MPPVPPHQLLSAYLDGELSASEREEVERLLERSPAAQQELLELEQVGMLLRQLPREALPNTFAPQVLEACLSDTGVFESQTPPPASAFPKLPQNGNQAQRRISRKRNNSWLGLTSVVMAASALGLILLLSWPKPDETNRENIAQNSQPQGTANTLGLPTNSADDNLEMQLASGDGNAVKALNDVRVQQEGQTEFAKKPSEAAEMQSATIAADALVGNAPTGANRKASVLANDNLKDLPVGQVVEALDHPGEHVAVVRLVVTDRKQGLKSLQTLLQKHQIANERPAESERDQFAAGALQSLGDSGLSAVYVETTDERFASILRELQQEDGIQKLTMDAPIEMAQFDPYIQSSNAKPGGEGQSRMMRFGGMRGGGVPRPQAFRNRAAMKAEAAPKPGPSAIEPKKGLSAKTGQPKPAAPSDPAKNGNKAPPEEPAALSKPSIATFGAAGSNSPRRMEKAAPKEDQPPSEAKPVLRDKEPSRQMAEPAPASSTQRELLLTPDDLKALQSQLAEPESKTPDAAPKDRSEQPSKPVQVLFVLVDQSANSEDSPPAPANALPSND